MFDPIYIYNEPIMNYTNQLDIYILPRLIENKLSGEDFFVEV